MRVILIFALLLLTTPAYAYIDPGMGSFMLQGLVATLFSASFIIKKYWQKIKSYSSKNKEQPITISTNTNINMPQSIGASFRDPSNIVFQREKSIYRKILPSGFSDYDFLIQSGLYDDLVAKGLLIPHEEILRNADEIIIKPTMIPFISYPYEWCFSQYQDAALLTLEAQKIAINFGMSLKDASAYNVQFYQGKPIFIDTMSFTLMSPNQPWIAYRQFCQHFLAPLALMAYSDLRLQKLMTSYIDGIPLDLAAKLLPSRTKLNPRLYFHIHLHAKYQQTSNPPPDTSGNVETLSTLKLKTLIDNLESAIKKLHLKKITTEWGDYYLETNYSDHAFQHKKQLISFYLNKIKPGSLLDLGSNDGSLTSLASSQNIFCIAADMDPIAIEKCYGLAKLNRDRFTLPLVLDLTNPSSDIGWRNQERDNFIGRVKVDCVMALAFLHHLVIGNNIPLNAAASFFLGLSPNLIIEFIPKTDSMVKNLLATRQDIFPDYSMEGFERIFSEKFTIERKEKIADSEGTLYWMSGIQ